MISYHIYCLNSLYVFLSSYYLCFCILGTGLLALRMDTLFTPAPRRDRSFYLSVFVFPYGNFTPFVIIMRRRQLDNTTFYLFPKLVILKGENSCVEC